MKITDFLVCDDIRHEIGGKMTLVGIYNDFVILKEKQDVKLPMTFRLGIYARIKMENSEETIPDAFDFEFSQGDNHGVAVSKCKIMIKDNPSSFALTVMFGNFPIKSEEKVKFKIRFYKSDVQLCELEPDYTMNVNIRDNVKKS